MLKNADSVGGAKESEEQADQKIVRQIKWSLILFLFCLWGMVCVWGITMYCDHVNNISQLLKQMNSAISDQTRNQLRLIQMVLMAIDGWLARNPKSTLMDEAFFDNFIHARKFRMESGLFIEIYAVDSQGKLFHLASDNKEALSNVNDREYFSISSKIHGTSIHISPPLKGRVSDDWVIPVILPLSIPRHGVHMLLVAIKVDILDNLYEQQRIKPTGNVALFRNDGILLAQTPLKKELLGENYAKEIEALFQNQKSPTVLISNSPFEKTKQFMSYSSLQEFPVNVMVSVDYHDILESFWKNLGVLVVLSIVISMATLLTGRQLMRLFVEQAILNAKVSRMATIDDLTGIWNRRHFVRLMNHEFERSRRYKNPLSLLLLDLDHFKKINDNYGHKMGDEVLIVFANTILKNLRNVDFFARFGGEEFMILLPQTPIQAAEHLAKRICKIISQLHIPTEQGEICFTTSIGVAAIQLTDTSPEEIMCRADRALYHAKSNGRNQVNTLDLTSKDDHVVYSEIGSEI